MSCKLPSIYSRQEALEIFGTEDPSIGDRALYFEECWELWKDNESEIRRITNARLIKEFSPWTFMMRYKCIRFKNKADLMLYLLISN